ncbi:MAG TPA: carbon-nitrogen hydrolase family protein [Chryseosolibacter sp.]|nr:carbon-nitrogen hydrolase family protein [Chryseosolibacter sp.]
MKLNRFLQIPRHLFLIAAVMWSMVTAFSHTAFGQMTGWKFESQRPEIAPASMIDEKVTFDGKATLALKGNGKDYAAGCWYTMVNVEPGTYYKFRTHFKSMNVDEPARSILARVIWKDIYGDVVGFREYPATLRNKSTDGWQIIEQSYQAPPEAAQAKLELDYRWDADGAVNFGGTFFEKTSAPEKRMVRLATVNHRPRNSKSAAENLAAFAALVDEAGAQKADIVCLPEGATIVGTPLNYISGSEPLPGPTTKYLGEVAKRNNLYIVAGLLEKDGDAVYNTAVLIDRQGHLAGKYRKTSLPREEIDGGVTPGNSFPVFDTDFGRIGIMICWDVTFPEPARALAQQGAEVIFLPIWGGDLTLAKARAIENQVYLVSSTYDMISAVFGLEGDVLKQAKEDKSVAVVEVDLSQHKLWPWLGDFKNRIPREMPSRKAIESVAGD